MGQHSKSLQNNTVCKFDCRRDMMISVTRCGWKHLYQYWLSALWVVKYWHIRYRQKKKSNIVHPKFGRSQAGCFKSWTEYNKTILNNRMTSSSFYTDLDTVWCWQRTALQARWPGQPLGFESRLAVSLDLLTESSAWLNPAVVLRATFRQDNSAHECGDVGWTSSLHNLTDLLQVVAWSAARVKGGAVSQTLTEAGC